MISKLAILTVFACLTTAAWAQQSTVFSSAPRHPAKTQVAPVSIDKLKPLEKFSGKVLDDFVEGKAVKLLVPPYPKEALAERTEGTVLVQVMIDKKGRIESAVPISGPQVFHDVVIQASKGAIFTPSRLNRKPIKVWGVITYNFVYISPLKFQALMLGMMLSMIRSDDIPLLGESTGGSAAATLMKMGTDVPPELKSEQSAFEELAVVRDVDRSAAASNLIEIIRSKANAEEKWRFETGECIGSIMVEIKRVFRENTEPGFTFDASKLDSHVRTLRHLTDRVPKEVPAKMVLGFKGVAAFADDPQLGSHERIMDLLVAIEAAMRQRSL